MKVTFDNVYNAFQIIAPKGTMISFTGEPTALADGVYLVGDDGIINLDEQFLTDTLYLSTEGTDYAVTGGMRVTYPLGDETVIIRAGSSTIPFSKGAKGGGSGSGTTKYKGTTTTPISNGSTTNPIIIDGEDYTAVFGDIVVYGYTEFVFDGTQWSEFGRPFDTTPTSGSANAVTSDGIKTALDTKQNIMQYAAMPTITASTLGKVVQYVGTSDGDYKHGWNYVAVSDGAAEPTYSWRALMDSNPTSESNNPVTSNGVYQRTPLYRSTNGGAQAGNGSQANTSGSIAVGSYARATGSASAAFGSTTSATGTAMMAVGVANNPRNGDYFEVGNGSNASSRSNIVEVNSTSLNVNGDIQKNGVGIDDYTTTERKIGKWIDGSDLYQRTFEVTELTNGQWNTSILGTSGISIVDVQGWIDWTYNGEPNCRTDLNYYANSSDYVSLANTYNDLDVKPNRTDAGMLITEAVITIKYTKPSAQANLMQTAPTEEISGTPTTVEEDDMR